MTDKVLIISTLVFAVIVDLTLAVYAARKLHIKTSLAYMLVMFSVVFYSLGWVVRLLGTTPDTIYLGIRISYMGAAFLGPFWFIMALSYSGYDKLLNRFVYGFLFVIPIITLVLVNTNEYHHWYYSQIDFRVEGPFYVAKLMRAPWHNVHILYNSITMACGTSLYLFMALRTSGSYRRQSFLMFFTSVIPWSSYFLYRLNLSYYHIDYTPFLLSLATVMFSISLFHFRLFDLIPIARGLVFETMNDPVIVMDNENRIVDWNNKARRIFDRQMGEVPQGRTAEDVFSEFNTILSQLTGREGEKVEILIPGAQENRYFYSRLIPTSSKTGKKIGKILSFQDITSEKALIEELQLMATTDALTGIYNRWMFLKICDQELKRARRNQTPISILLIDLDHFKSINDTYGHDAGDLVLENAARCFQENLRSSDVLARYGGEEFIILLPETDRKGALVIAKKHNQNIASMETIFRGCRLSITASIGVSASDATEIEPIEQLISKADKAMYTAKNSSRNCVVEYG